jgi:hypothetical protein
LKLQNFTAEDFFFFETGFPYVAQAGLKLAILLPQSAGITGVHHHAGLIVEELLRLSSVSSFDKTVILSR